MKRKRVILFIVDALGSRVCVPHMKSGRLPNLAKLVELGFLREESISIFPSLTPAATSTIACGRYPAEHGILGFHWYDREVKEVAYYGDDFWIVNALGFGNFFDGCLRRLNAEKMQCETIFERLAEESDRRSASLNYLIFRGKTLHKAKIPLWFSWHSDVPFEEDILGPDELFFGDFVTSNGFEESDLPNRDKGILGRFGFNDGNTAALVEHFAKNDLFPDFTLAYFPDHDYKAHDVGLEEAVSQLEEFDSLLGGLYDIYGGPQRTLELFNIVVTGDHSQSDVEADKAECRVNLHKLFEGHPVADSGEWEDEEIKVFADMRCAQVYLPQSLSHLREELTEQALEDSRVDQVLWRPDQDGFMKVVTKNRGSCRFRRTAEGVADDYGNRWEVSGEMSCLNAEVKDGRLVYRDYPNALERIWGGLAHPSSADLWLTSRLGYEFVTRVVKAHVGGGSHGSLHRLDSLSPLIVGGARSVECLPDKPRLVDIVPLCLELLGLSSET